MLWSLFYRNNHKEVKVHARGSRYQSVTPCSFFFNQASFRLTSLISTNESRFDKRVSSRFSNKRVSYRFSNKRVSYRFSNKRVSYRFSNKRVSYRFSNKRVSYRFSNKRVSLKIVYRVTHKSWRLKIEWFPRNREWSKMFHTFSSSKFRKRKVLT